MGKAGEEAHTLEEMLAAQTQVSHLVMGYIGTMSLKCAIELNIPEIIATKNGGFPVSFSDLLSRLPSIPPSKAPFLHRIMRLLAQMGYFKVEKKSEEESSEMLYSVTPLSSILRKDTPISFSPWILGLLFPRHMNTMRTLSGWLQWDKPEGNFKFAHGMSMYEMCGRNPEYNSLVNELMASDTQLTIKAVVEQHKEAFQGLHTLVDVGGGAGAAAHAIARAFLGLKCTVFDLPHVVASVPKSSLVDAVGGDMFELIPRADAVFLKYIMHNWGDEDCIRILKKCKDAIPQSGGKVIIVDIVLNDRENCSEIITQQWWDVCMMCFTEGLEREEHEWRKLFTAAGFTGYKITPVGLRSLIQVFP